MIRTENWCGHNIRFIEIDGEWLAILKDICDALNLRSKDVSQRLDPSMIKKVKVSKDGSNDLRSRGYNNTYGNYVIIKHHSGYKTLYAHMSEIKAKQGDYVGQDTVIGYVGSTGLSTGPHLHFSVFKNGKQVNPANLWN